MNRGRWSETEVMMLPERWIVRENVVNQCCDLLNHSGGKGNLWSEIV